MANDRYASTPVCGVDFDARDATPVFAIGTMIQLAGGGGPEKACYVQANGTIAASQSDITVDASGQASDGLGTWENSATAFADNEYGWVWVTDNS